MSDLTEAIEKIVSAARDVGRMQAELKHIKEEMDAEQIYFEKRDDETGEQSAKSGEQLVLDNIADPYAQLGKVADIVLANLHDEVEIGRQVKKLITSLLEGERYGN